MKDILYRGNSVNRIYKGHQEIGIPYSREGLISMTDYKGYAGKESYVSYNLVNETDTYNSIDPKYIDMIESKDCFVYNPDINTNGIRKNISIAALNYFESSFLTVQYDLYVPDIDTDEYSKICALFSANPSIYIFMNLSLSFIKVRVKDIQGEYVESLINVDNLYNLVKNKFVTVTYILDQDNTSLSILLDNNYIVKDYNIGGVFGSSIIHGFETGNTNSDTAKDISRLYNIRVYDSKLSMSDLVHNMRVSKDRFNCRYVQGAMTLDIRSESKAYTDGDTYTYIKDHSGKGNDMRTRTDSSFRQSTIDKFITFDEESRGDEQSFHNSDRFIINKESFTCEVSFTINKESAYHRGLIGYDLKSGFSIGIFNSDYENELRMYFKNGDYENGKLIINQCQLNKLYVLSVSYNFFTKSVIVYMNKEKVYTGTGIEYYPAEDLTFYLASLGYRWRNATDINIHSARVYQRDLNEDEILLNQSVDLFEYKDCNIPTTGIVMDLDGRQSPVKTSNANFVKWMDCTGTGNNIGCMNDANRLFKYHRCDMSYELGGNRNGVSNILSEGLHAYTVSLWCKTEWVDGKQYSMIYSQNEANYKGYVGFYKFNNLDIIKVNYIQGFGDIENYLDCEKYNHIVLVNDYDNKIKKLYINGILVKDMNCIDENINYLSNIVLGYDTTESITNAHTWYKKVTVYDRCLSDDEVKQYYNACDNIFNSDNTDMIFSIDGRSKPIPNDDNTRYYIKDMVSKRTDLAYIDVMDDSMKIWDEKNYRINVGIDKTGPIVIDKSILMGDNKRVTISIGYNITNSVNIYDNIIKCIMTKRRNSKVQEASSSANRDFILFTNLKSISLRTDNHSDQRNILGCPCDNEIVIDLVFNGNNVICYVNGEYKDTLVYDVLFNGTEFDINVLGETTIYKSDGYLTHFKVYNSCLKKEQIKSNYDKYIKDFIDPLSIQTMNLEDNVVYYTDMEPLLNIPSDQESIILNNCRGLQTIIIPEDNKVKSIIINDCPDLHTLSIDTNTDHVIDLSALLLDKFNISNCENVTSIIGLNLTSDTIPDNLCNGLSITSIKNFFDDKYCPRVIGSYFMNNCNKLTKIDNMFEDKNIEVVGKYFMCDCSNLVSATGVFKNSKLKALPEKMLYNTKIKYLRYSFQNCTHLASGVYSDHLAGFKYLVDIAYMFDGCKNLTGNHVDYIGMKGEGLFPQLSDFKCCFRDCIKLNDYNTIQTELK